MSKFFEAFEQAERDRALQGPAQASIPRAAPATPEGGPTSDKPVVEVSGPVDEHLVSLLKPTSWEAEQYRALRHVVERTHLTSGLQIVGVSSPGGRDGKTLTAINLAGALAQAPGIRVLLIDMDLRHPGLASHLGFDDIRNGLVEAILNPQLTLDDVVHSCPTFNLAVLAARRSLNATYELLNSERCKDLIDAARKRYDYIVVDLPSVVPIPDCQIVQTWIDGFLLVVAAHQTPGKLLESALDALSPDKVLGLVFNRDDRGLGAYDYARNEHEARVWRRVVRRRRDRKTRPPVETHQV